MSPLKNSKSAFGLVTIILHWAMALIIIGQFSLGLYMLSLDYYDPNYHSLPHYHKSIGVIFAALLLFRIFWMVINPKPGPVAGVSYLEHRLGRIVQITMLTLLVCVVCLGYLISTAKGDSIAIFNWFEIPATITSIEDQEDWAGERHYWIALTVIVLAGVHTLAALKHHFINKDTTLIRMMGKK